MAKAESSKEHVVVICEDWREESCPFIVAPGRLVAQKGDTVLFRNTTEIDVTVQFLTELPFGTYKIVITAKGRALKTVGDVAPGGYPYKAHCGAHEAEGSKPIIIIYD